MIEFTTWDIVRNLLLAARWTIVLSLVAFAGGALMGGLALMMRTSRVALLRRVSWAYIELFQGTPLLMQLFLAFFGLSLAGVEVPPWLAAGAALTLWSGAFLAEIWRGCVEAIPKGQWEASASLALGYVQQMRYVVLPQALTIALPPLLGQYMNLIKNSSLTMAIGVAELSYASRQVETETLRTFQAFGVATLLYIAVIALLEGWGLWRQQRRLQRGH